MLVLAGCGRPAADREDWDVLFMLGDRIGYQRTTHRHATQSGREVVQVEVFAHMAVERFGKKLVSDLQSGDTETPDGVVLDFFSETRQRPTPQRMTGRVQGNHVELQTTSLGKGVSKSIPWSADYGGYAAVEDSLVRQPMQPGQRRTIRAPDGRRPGVADGPDRPRLRASAIARRQHGTAEDRHPGEAAGRPKRP